MYAQRNTKARSHNHLCDGRAISIAFSEYTFVALTYTACSAHALYYRGADKSLDRPGRKQATATEDFEYHISYL
jgi:hypothetical protein